MQPDYVLFCGSLSTFHLGWFPVVLHTSHPICLGRWDLFFLFRELVRIFIETLLLRRVPQYPTERKPVERAHSRASWRFQQAQREPVAFPHAGPAGDVSKDTGNRLRGCIPGLLEMSPDTTRTGGVSAFPSQLELDRFKDAAGVGVGVGGLKDSHRQEREPVGTTSVSDCQSQRRRVEAVQKLWLSVRSSVPPGSDHV